MTDQSTLAGLADLPEHEIETLEIVLTKLVWAYCMSREKLAAAEDAA